MKKIFALAVLLLVSAIAAFGQASNSVTVTVQAVPAAPVISVAPLNYYQATAASMTITVGSGGVSSSCTGTWDALPLTLTFTAASGVNPAKFTAPVTTGMTANLGNHSVVINCPQPVLSLANPNVTLPNGVKGIPYQTSIATLAGVSGGKQPYSWSINSGALPTGLSLSSSGVVSGSPSGVGSFNFIFKVTDSSGLALLIDVSPIHKTSKV